MLIFRSICGEKNGYKSEGTNIFPPTYPLFNYVFFYTSPRPVVYCAEYRKTQIDIYIFYTLNFEIIVQTILISFRQHMELHVFCKCVRYVFQCQALDLNKADGYACYMSQVFKPVYLACGHSSSSSAFNMSDIEEHNSG